MITLNPFTKLAKLRDDTEKARGELSALRVEAESIRAERLSARARYIALMQDCLTNVLYEDPPLARFGSSDYNPAHRECGRDWPSVAHTMIGAARMNNLREVVETVISDRIPGDLLEAGVWRGGACIFMRAILKAHAETGRRVWVADSFAGVPPPDADRYPADKGQTFHEYADLAVPLEVVRKNFARYDLLDDQVAFLKGWFKDTLPGAPIEKLAVLRVDGDLYESTLDVLTNLYDKLSVGGFVIVDDYGVVEACRKATDEFRTARGIVDPIQIIDGVGVFWRKSGGSDYPARVPGRIELQSSGGRPAALSGGGLCWETDANLRIGDVHFLVSCDVGELMATDSTPTRFVVGKARSMVEDSVTLGRRRKLGKIFEFGIFKGGSMVLNDLIHSPSRIAAVEFSRMPVKALSRYIGDRGKEDVIKPYYGIDQADRKAVERVLLREFPDRDLDMIVDDASHLYDKTRAAFNISFPYLRPGGLYVIEDWAWAHWTGDFWQKNNPYFGEKPAMSNLLIELFMLAASRADWIESIQVTNAVITITKGAGALPPGDFDLGEHYLLRGRKFEAPL